MWSAYDSDTAVGVFISSETALETVYLRNKSGRIKVLPTPEFGTAFTPEGINNWGTIVGRAGSFPSSHGFIQTDGRTKFYDYPHAAGTALTDVSDKGDILGTWNDEVGVPHGFLLRKGRTVAIEVPGSLGTRPNGINNHDQIVGTYFGTDEVRHGFLLDHGTYKTLDYPNASSTVLIGINDVGVIVGTYDDFSFGLVATPEK